MDVSDRTVIAAQVRAMASLLEVAEVDKIEEFTITFEEVRAERPVAWLKQINGWHGVGWPNQVSEALRQGTVPAFDSAEQACVHSIGLALYDTPRIPENLYRQG